MRFKFFSAALVLVSLALGVRGAAVSPEVAEEALRAQGFKKIEITNKHWAFVGLRGCPDTATARFIATAVSIGGMEVQLSVCTDGTEDINIQRLR